MKLWESPLATFEIEATDAGISSLRLMEHQNGTKPVPEEMSASLTEHLYGRAASLRLDLQSVTSPIAQLTLAKLLEIPYGEVRSYAWVAKEIGQPKAVRPVANAVAANPLPVLIPCHRVVRSDGHIGNYSLGGTEMKCKLLAFEGLDITYAETLAASGVRMLADRETNTYHLPSCRLAPRADAVAALEIRHLDEAVQSYMDPCRRCRPI